MGSSFLQCSCSSFNQFKWLPLQGKTLICCFMMMIVRVSCSFLLCTRRKKTLTRSGSSTTSSCSFTATDVDAGFTRPNTESNGVLCRDDGLWPAVGDHWAECGPRSCGRHVEILVLRLATRHRWYVPCEQSFTIPYRVFQSLLTTILVGEHSLGSILKSSNFASSTTKNVDSLQISIDGIQNMDDLGIYWLRSLVKSKSLHSMIESFLLFASEVGRTKDPRLNALEAGLILSHASDIVGTLIVVKNTPLRFDVKAVLSAEGSIPKVES